MAWNNFDSVNDTFLTQYEKATKFLGNLNEMVSWRKAID